MGDDRSFTLKRVDQGWCDNAGISYSILPLFSAPGHQKVGHSAAEHGTVGDSCPGHGRETPVCPGRRARQHRQSDEEGAKDVRPRDEDEGIVPLQHGLHEDGVEAAKRHLREGVRGQAANWTAARLYQTWRAM